MIYLLYIVLRLYSLKVKVQYHDDFINGGNSDNQMEGQFLVRHKPINIKAGTVTHFIHFYVIACRSGAGDALSKENQSLLEFCFDKKNDPIG